MAEYLIVCTAPYLAFDGTTQPAGTAFNRIAWDGVTPFNPGADLVVIADDGRSIYQTPAPQPALPSTVALWKIKIVLSEQPSPANAGKTMLDDANAAVAAASMATQIAWANAADVSQTSPTLAGVAAALGMQTTEVVTLYAAACAVSL